MPHVLIALLINLIPHSPYLACIRANEAAIASTLAKSEHDYGVPPSVLLVVGLLESHLGCNPRSGGCWGAPIDMQHRNVAGTPLHAARALASSYRVCGTWRGAIGRFRSGLCRPTQHAHTQYVARAMTWIERLNTGVGVSTPR